MKNHFSSKSGATLPLLSLRDGLPSVAKVHYAYIKRKVTGWSVFPR